jgi:hypothetical protein
MFSNNNSSLSKNDKMIILAVVIVLVILAVYAYKKGFRTRMYEHLNCESCSKCGEGMKRPNLTARSCSSTKCKCVEDIKPVDSSYYRLKCSTCPQCDKGMGRPVKEISTTRRLGCNDRRCRCQSLD